MKREKADEPSLLESRWEGHEEKTVGYHMTKSLVTIQGGNMIETGL